MGLLPFDSAVSHRRRCEAPEFFISLARTRPCRSERRWNSIVALGCECRLSVMLSWLSGLVRGEASEAGGAPEEAEEKEENTPQKRRRLAEEKLVRMEQEDEAAEAEARLAAVLAKRSSRLSADIAPVDGSLEAHSAAAPPPPPSVPPPSAPHVAVFPAEVKIQPRDLNPDIAAESVPLDRTSSTAHLFASCSALYQKTHSVDHFSRHYSQLKELKATKTTGAVAVALLSNSRTTSVLRSSCGCC